MTTDVINGKVKTIIMAHFPLAKKKSISNDDSLLESGILDSLGVLDLVVHLEKEFNLTVADDELVPENFHSITSLTKYIQTKCDGVSK